MKPAELLRDAMALQQQGQHEAAAERYQALLEHQPLPAGLEQAVRYNLAAALRADGRLDEAQQCYEQALGLDEEDADCWSGLGLVYADLGQPEVAVQAHQRAVALCPSAGALVNLGNALRSAGERSQAISAFEHAIALEPDHAAGSYNLHAALYRDDAPGPALAALEQALAAAPSHRHARFFRHALQRWHGLPTHDVEAPAFLFDSLSFALERRDPDTRSFADTFETLRFAATLVTGPGEVVELGVRHGTTLRFLASQFPDRQLHGFDSFEGLPEAWGDQPAGLYSTMGAQPTMPANVCLHPGWFESTLSALAGSSEALALVHVDCDLYASTHTALTSLAPRIRAGCVLVFDEYLCNPGWRDEEHRAWTEAAHQFGWSYHYAAFSLFSKQAVVVVDEQA